MILTDFRRLQSITEHYRRAKEYWKGELNNISGQLGILMCSLKESKVQEIG